MDNLFLIQLVTSFFVGGFIIALLSIVVERANEKVAGIIISFPTTIAIGFFFIQKIPRSLLRGCKMDA